MEVSNNRNNYLFYNPKEAEENAAKILQGSTWVEPNLRNLESHNDGASLRAKVWEVIDKNGSFSALSPKALRASKHCNPELFDILHYKRLGHALRFEGQMKLSKGAFKLEGFYETFTIPMLGTSLLKWASNKPLEQKKASAIESILLNALCHDHLDDKKIAKALLDLAQGTPVMLGGGWHAHSINVILLQDNDEDYNYVIIGNRGDDYQSGGGISGWNVYKTRKIDALFIKNVATTLTHQKSDYLSSEKLVKDYGAKLIYSYPMKEQKMGNCTYTSLKAGICALMKIWEKNEGFQRVSEELFLKIEKNKENDSYKSFSLEDKQLVLEDFLIDLKENKEADIKSIADKLYYMLILRFPTQGFNMGWKLWIETLELCVQLSPRLKSLELVKFMKQLIKEDSEFLEAKSPLEGVTKLIFKLVDEDFENTTISSTVSYLISFVDRGIGLNEAKAVCMKLLQAQHVSPALNLITALLKKGEDCENELAVCKYPHIECIKATFNSDTMQNFIQTLATFDKIEILKEWSQDISLRKIMDSLVKDVYNCSDNEVVKKLLPFISKETRDFYEMKVLCTQFIKTDHLKEASELATHFQKSEKDKVLHQIAEAYINKKSWDEASLIIKKIESRNVKFLAFTDLHIALKKEHLTDDAKKIKSEIKKLFY